MLNISHLRAVAILGIWRVSRLVKPGKKDSQQIEEAGKNQSNAVQNTQIVNQWSYKGKNVDILSQKIL